MRILSIGFGDKKKVKYEKANNAGITETYQLSTEDDFRPEILEAYVKARALVIETFKVFKLFEEEWLKIKSISFKWHKEMPKVITEAKYVLIITNKYGEKLIPLAEEIELFVRGARAQGKLWEEELDADAVEGETFHINDLVQEGKEND